MNNLTEEKIKQRKKDVKALKKAKELEQKQMQRGYKWLSKGRSRRLVSPKNQKQMLSIGWKTAYSIAA